MSSKEEPGVEKLVSVLAISLPVTAAREEAVKNSGASKDSENSRTTTGVGENGKNPRTNLAQISCI